MPATAMFMHTTREAALISIGADKGRDFGGKAGFAALREEDEPGAGFC